MPFALLIELFTHQAWADAELLQAVSSQPDAASDRKLIATMQHIVVVQRLFAAMVTSATFEMQNESRPIENVAALRELFVVSHRDLLRFINDSSAESLDRILPNPRMPELKSTIGETLMHVILHSQNHRGQCLMRLRELTGEAPVLDFLMWVKLGRPDASASAYN